MDTSGVGSIFSICPHANTAKKKLVPAIISYASNFNRFERIILLKRSLLFRGIMVKNVLNICIADKSVQFDKDVRFGILIKKISAPGERSSTEREVELHKICFLDKKS